ncbi:MAG: IclR family transcriptional regulator [Kiritimatiellae bacterium]|jgi:IclR family KDG regulon transcriptional repressor|nr:IclR family transcriptional regulator [Kiritimatiellia bacterium]
MNNTLQNGFRVLELLSSTGESFSVKEIANTMDVPNSHACRLLKTLTEAGYVKQNSSRQYKISMKVLSLANMCLSKNQIRQKVHPFILKLSKDLKLDAYFSMPVELKPMIVEAAYYRANQNASLTAGSFNPIHCSASGKVCAAYYSENELKDFFKSNTLVKHTEHTITSKNKFRQQLKEILKSRIAWTEMERDPDSVACASPIFNSEGEMVGIIGGNFGSKISDKAKLQEYGKQIRATAAAASFALGYAEYDV